MLFAALALVFLVCGGIINASQHGSISSPGSPGNYPSNRDCEWHLSTSPQKRILFHFFQLMIGDNTDCSKDYLQVSPYFVVMRSSTTKYFYFKYHNIPLTYY